jgi:hypothetical protein
MSEGKRGGVGVGKKDKRGKKKAKGGGGSLGFVVKVRADVPVSVAHSVCSLWCLRRGRLLWSPLRFVDLIWVACVCLYRCVWLSKSVHAVILLSGHLPISWDGNCFVESRVFPKISSDTQKKLKK